MDTYICAQNTVDISDSEEARQMKRGVLYIDLWRFTEIVTVSEIGNESQWRLQGNRKRRIRRKS